MTCIEWGFISAVPMLLNILMVAQVSSLFRHNFCVSLFETVKNVPSLCAYWHNWFLKQLVRRLDYRKLPVRYSQITLEVNVYTHAILENTREENNYWGK